MASLDDIMNITEDRAEIVLETDVTKNHNVLFTFDEIQPIAGRVAYNNIYYLDSSKSFIPTKPMGKYIL